jgi:hypothetical protein
LIEDQGATPGSSSTRSFAVKGRAQPVVVYEVVEMTEHGKL